MPERGPICRRAVVLLKATFHSDANTEVLGDPALLRRVIDNLVTNAIKFSPSSTEVVVDVNGAMQMLDGRPGGGSSVPLDDGPGGGGSYGSNRGTPPAAAPESGPTPDFDDDIPF